MMMSDGPKTKAALSAVLETHFTRQRLLDLRGDLGATPDAGSASR